MADIIYIHAEHLRLRGRAETSIRQRIAALGRVQRSIGRPLLRATEQDLLAWRKGLKIADRSIRFYAVQLNGFYEWACEEEYIMRNPARKLPVPPAPIGLPRPMPEHDLRLAVRTSSRRVRPWFILGGWLGLRAKEIALLQRDLIRDDDSEPHIIITPDSTKGRRGRVLPLPSLVLAELHAYGLPRSGPVFRSQNGSCRSISISPHTVSHEANLHLHSLDIWSTFHATRHRFATRLYAATGDIRIVQAMLGHRSLDTTSLYTAYSVPRAVAAMEQLPGLDEAA